MAAGKGMERMINRLFDIVISFVGLVVTLPATIVVMILLIIDSPRDIFFGQWRLGQHGKPFKMYKFRKFPPEWSDGGPGLTVAFDSRMTGLGAFLEKTKLDELPQLWNILKGDMSVVGPRPESLKFKELLTGKYAAVLDFKPGIFGPNQILFRNEADLYPPDIQPEQFYRQSLFQQKAENDLAYFQKANLFSNLMLIFKGVWVTFFGVVNWQRFVGLHLRIIVIDILMIEVAFIMAHLTRYSGMPPKSEWGVTFLGIWFLPAFMIIGMALSGCYRNPVRYFYVPDALRLSFSITFFWIVFYIIMLSTHRALSLYLIPLVWVFLLVFMFIPRVAIRLYRERKPLAATKSFSSGVVIYGAGSIGMTLSNLINGRASHMKLYGFIDDSHELRGRRIYGHEVLGRESDIHTIHAVHKFDELWVTFPPDQIKRRRLQAFCQKENVRMIVLTEMEPFSRIFKD